MTKDEIILYMYTDKEFDKLIKKLCQSKPHFVDDLKQDIIMDFMKKDEALLIQLYNDNKLLNYFSRAVKLQISSNTSPFYYKYRRTLFTENEINYKNDIEEDIEEDDFIKNFDIYKYVKNNNILNFVEFFIFNAYFKLNNDIIIEEFDDKMTYSKIANILGVKKSTIYKNSVSMKYKVFSHILYNEDLKLELDSKSRNRLHEYIDKHKHNDYVKNKIKK